MRKAKYELSTVKERVAELKGHPVKMLVNRGRKRIARFTGVLENTYPSVFTVRIDNSKSVDLLSYSYSDVLCGDVKLSRI